MKIAMVGLGRMGANMAQRLASRGHECFAWDRNPSKTEILEKKGVRAAQSLEDLVAKLSTPRIVWMMLPAGAPTEETIQKFSTLLHAGDILIDGGNAHFKDDIRRSKFLAGFGITYLDVGVSGGVWGLDRGYCLMAGGDRQAFLKVEPAFKALAPGQEDIERTAGRAPSSADEGYLYCGPSGSGHFVKMVHNGIEYGMMQALAEGFDILQGARSESLPEDRRYNLDIASLAELWRRGSVISSWLLDLIAISLSDDAKLSKFQGRVEDSGEGRWTVQTAIEESIPADVISTALYVRFRSRRAESFAEKLLSAMRNQFGGHEEAKLKKAS